MSATPRTQIPRAQQLALEAAERRVLGTLRTPSEPRSSPRMVAALAGAVILFAVTFSARLAIHDPSALIANFYIAPIALLAIEFGARAGILGAAVAMALTFVWTAINTVELGVLGWVSRGTALLIAGVLVGRFSDRLRDDIAKRQRAQRQLSLYADELERANAYLAESVERLEAFAEIAREVGGETDLERILTLILAHCRNIVAASEFFVCLLEGEHLIVLSAGTTRTDLPERLPLQGSLPGAALLGQRPRRVTAAEEPRLLAQLAPGARAAVLVPLIFRGENLGVLVGIGRDEAGGFAQGDEQLLLAVAASAGTAIATARSVAAARLRLSLEAAEQARARWARELHDETLQALTGARMVLSAGLAHRDPVALRQAAQTADEHIAEELRNLRDLIVELRPAALDDLGLGPAIESLASRQATIGGFAVDVALEVDREHRLERETEGAIYRIVQEALSNVVKHAGAQHVHLRVRQLEGRVEITVRDDGNGFDRDFRRQGFGVTGMQERAMLAGGRLELSSAAAGGTCVTAILPVPGSSSAAALPSTT